MIETSNGVESSGNPRELTPDNLYAANKDDVLRVNNVVD
jgi:hypothetical protein